MADGRHSDSGVRLLLHDLSRMAHQPVSRRDASFTSLLDTARVNNAPSLRSF